MTKPCYSQDCAAAFKVQGQPSSSPVANNSNNAWIVNFNNGNDNNNNKNNNNYVRLVRSGECLPVDVPPSVCFLSYRALYQAFIHAKKRKKPSHNRLVFEQDWLSKLCSIQTQLTQHTWQPSPSVCFVAKRPKAREIHAPDFADRVVHHWLVPQLEAIYEPVFISHSFANRKHKGTHAAVKQLQGFVRQVHSGQGGGYYLQLDIHNFFNSIHRATLYGLLKNKLQKIHPNPPLQKEGTSSQKILHIIHALLRHHPKRAVSYVRATQQELALVPPHKRLGNAAQGCGLPIGNLSSQFFANVYLNELDQFVKHTLKAKRYVRYVDDFVLVHPNKAQLEAWLVQIQDFLHTRLQLRLKDDIKLQALTTGIDFLGYWLYPTHTLVRPRVIHHAHEKLSAWQYTYVRRTADGWLINATASQQDELCSVWASYQGHFKHANSVKLEASFYQQYGWLQHLSPYQAPVSRAKTKPLLKEVSSCTN